jgi:signal transduction histidine kinase
MNDSVPPIFPESREPPGAWDDPDGVSVGVFGATLANVVRVVGGWAGLVLLWDNTTGARVHISSYGLGTTDRAELDALVEHAAPGLLGALPVDGDLPPPAEDDAPPVDPAHGWQVDPQAAEARIQTRLGRLHLLVFPIGAQPVSTAPASTPPEGAGDDTRTRGRLVGLLCLIHPQRRLNLRRAYPAVYDLLVTQAALVTQNFQLVQRLIHESRWLAATLEHTSEGLLILDPQRRVLGGNQASAALTGWTLAELQGRDVVTTLDLHLLTWVPAARTFEEEAWAGPFAPPPAAGADAVPATPDSPPDPAPTPPLDLVLTTRQGTRIYTEGRVSMVHDATGAVLGVVLGLRDVTAQREAEELQATFLSVISHDLQTPLAVIRGYAELLSDQVGSMKPRELRQKLDIVAEESAKLSKMVTNLLDASRIQAGGLELKLEPIDLRRLVERVVQKMGALTDKHRMVVGMSQDLPPVLADYERVEQVLTNLLENAIKYSPAGGTISITDDLTSDEVIIHVSDEGIGVPEAERQRIFSRFHRLNSRQVRQMKGVGLGLYIARAIVGAHGGRIWVDAAPGGGAQFSFSLPRQHKAPVPILFGRG